MALTPRVFWAVMAVRADVPKTPNAWKVLRSAWMPAPPPLSEPAMVRAMESRFGVMALPQPGDMVVGISPFGTGPKLKV